MLYKTIPGAHYETAEKDISDYKNYAGFGEAIHQKKEQSFTKSMKTAGNSSLFLYYILNSIQRTIFIYSISSLWNCTGRDTL